MKSIYHIHKNEETGVFYVHNTSTGETVQLVAALNIADLEAADLPLSGLEKTQVVQNGENKSVRVGHIAELVPVPGIGAVLAAGNDASDRIISALGNPGDPKDAANKEYVDGRGIYDVLTVGQDLGGDVSINCVGNEFKINNASARLHLVNGIAKIGDIEGDGNNTKIIIKDADNVIELIGQSAFTGKAVFNGNVNMNHLQEYPDNASALGAGLINGDLYYTNVAGEGIVKMVIVA